MVLIYKNYQMNYVYLQKYYKIYTSEVWKFKFSIQVVCHNLCAYFILNLKTALQYHIFILAVNYKCIKVK